MTLARGYFLTGTDTDIGKTFAACALLHAWRAQGLRAVGYKPIAAGGEILDDVLVNDDARKLHAASSSGFTLAQINPVCLREAIAPHIAAAHEGVHFDFEALLSGYQQIARQVDRVLVEGAGGFCVPLDAARDTTDMARAFNLPVILVVGMRLGCLNHALLTIEAIAARGLPLAGWIANTLSPDMPFLAENIHTLRERIAAPCLGVLPRFTEAADAAHAAASLLTLPD